MASLKGEERARYVADMFNRIARRYDLMNFIMSGGRHGPWRRKATALAVEGLPDGLPPGKALDVAAGTGDFSIDLARRAEVESVAGLDFAREMMLVGIRKTKRKGVADSVSFIQGDAHKLPFADESFICATVGFGIRNFTDVPKALREMARVVKPGGRVVSLEIVRMDGKDPISWAARLHFRYVTPWLGALIAGDREAYTYLPESAQSFMSADELTKAMKDAGLKVTVQKKLALGAAAIHVGEKKRDGVGD